MLVLTTGNMLALFFGPVSWPSNLLRVPVPELILRQPQLRGFTIMYVTSHAFLSDTLYANSVHLSLQGILHSILCARMLLRLRGAYHSLTSEGMRSIRTQMLSRGQVNTLVLNHDQSSQTDEIESEC